MSYLSKAKEVLSHSGKLPLQQGRATLITNRRNTVRDQGQVWNADDWREYFDERAGVAEYCGMMPREKADQQAFEGCVTRWMDTTPANVPVDVCPHCLRKINPLDPSTAFVVNGGGHMLHHSCNPHWITRRRQEAIIALAGIGIYPPRTINRSNEDSVYATKTNE